jgi:type II secretion system protein D
MNTPLKLLAGTAIAALALTALAQNAAPVVVAQSLTPAANRLSAVAFDDLTNAPAAAPTKAVPTSRLGAVTVAQIPAQSVPGQNPNTVRPLARPNVVNPKAKAAGSPAPTTAPAPVRPQPTAATPAPNGPPPGSPVNSQPIPPPAAPPAPAADPSTPATADDEEIELQYVNVPMPQILLLYEDLTGKKVIRDINVEAVTFTIETTGKLPKAKAIDYIEKSLLLNGYGFIPAGEGMVKFLNFASIKPSPEHPILFTADALPKNGEEVATFIQPLQFLDPDDLQKTLTTLVPLHGYGVIQPLPNARGIAITENTNTIRYIIELLKHLDVEPSRTEKRTFQLTRASAEDVAKALADILDLEGKGSSKSGGGKSGGGATPQPVQPQPAGIPNQPGAAPQAAHTGVYGAAAGPQATATPPKIVPIPRTNKLLIIARPVDLDMIAGLIEELDGAAEIRNFVSRPLKYLDAGNVLQILGDSLSRLVDNGDGSASGGKSGGSLAGGSGTNNQTNNQTSGGYNRNSSFGNNSFGSNGQNGGFGSSGIGGGGSSMGGGGNSQPLRKNDDAQSLVIGKTLLIADPTQNMVFISGPPEHLETVNMILDEIDVRPKAVVLNVVIGSLGLDDNKEFGIDYLFNPQEVGFTKNGSIAGAATTKNGGFLDPSSISSIKDFGTVANGLSLFGTFNDKITVALKALNAGSDFKVLSRPTIFTLNNQPAYIQTGTKVPVPTSTLGGYGNTTGGINNGINSVQFQTNIAYQDVFLSLNVAPLILNDDEIKLNVHQENNSLGDSTKLGGNDVPSIISQGLDTTVLVKNNATVLLGGLITESITKSRNGIPILKDIPILKYAFSSSSDKKNRKELLIFISPRIVNGEGDLPPNYQDSIGASPLAADTLHFLTEERTDPARDQKTVRRSKLGQLLQRLFN